MKKHEIIEPQFDQFLSPPFGGHGEICGITSTGISKEFPIKGGLRFPVMGVWFVGKDTECCQPVYAFILN